MKRHQLTIRPVALLAAVVGLLCTLAIGASALQLRESSAYSVRACGTISCSSDADCQGTFCPFCDTVVSNTCRDIQATETR